MLEPQRPRENHLLRALPISEWARITPHLELVPLPLGEVLYESGNELQHVHFPATDAIPGSTEKLDILAQRIQLGLPLWHPKDRLNYDKSGTRDD